MNTFTVKAVGITNPDYQKEIRVKAVEDDPTSKSITLGFGGAPSG